ncbi:MAG: hypothetical protein HQL30_03580 [Candidatus Omnitrophica bacterium]|nr:hypothetical protein [Candidatus Omnitrophota bacterium]
MAGKMNIFCVSSYVCLKDFFNVFREDEINRVVVLANRDLFDFLGEVIVSNTTEIINIDEVDSGFLFISNPAKVRRWLNDTFPFLAGEAGKVYYFCNLYTMAFFFLIDHLRKRGATIIFINSDKHMDAMKKPVVPNLKETIKYSFLMRVLYGFEIKISEISGHRAKMYGYDDAAMARRGGREWAELSGALGPRIKGLEDVLPNSLLIVDYPMQDIKGVDVTETGKKLETVLLALIGKGMNLYHKSHPNSYKSCLDGLRVKAMSREVSRYIPVELVMNRFKRVAAFSSLGLRDYEGEILGLGGVLVFANEKDKRDFYTAHHVTVKNSCKYMDISGHGNE